MEGKRAKSEEVLTRLLDHIQAEGLRPSDSLPSEERLAEMFGVSRVSIREAMRGLKFLGMLEARTRRGTVIANVNIEVLSRYIGFQLASQPMSVRELFQARCAIEVGCLATFHGKIGEDACKRLIAVAENGLSASSSQSPAEHARLADLDFHGLLLREIGNPALMAFSSLLERFFLVLKGEKSTHESRGKVIEEHRRIVKFLGAGKGAAASKIMQAHLEYHMNHLLKNLQ